MNQIQQWFAPLLWIIATLTAIGAFIRFCRPVWNFFKAPAQMIDKIDANAKQDEENFKTLSNKLANTDHSITNLQTDLTSLTRRMSKVEDIELSLLHDQIIQIYQAAIAEGSISDDTYKRVCSLYEQNGGSDFIKTLMDELTYLHSNGVIKKVQ